MKRCSRWARRSWLMGGALLLVACGGKSTLPEEEEEENPCAGDYAGTYSGDVSGPLTGKLEESGRFTVGFYLRTTATSITGSGTVDENGAIAVNLEGNRITGALNSRCSAKGDWQFADTARGTWQMNKR